MKIPNILLGIILLTIHLSCNPTDEGSSGSQARLYELQFINTGLSGQIIQKENLDFNEFLEFLPDSTFVKRRVYVDSTSIAQGTYSFIKSEAGNFFELEYKMESYLIQSCGTSPSERVSILNDKEIFNGSFMPCDGPGYGYKIVEQ